MPVKIPETKPKGPKKPFDPRGPFSIVLLIVGVMILSNLVGINLPLVKNISNDIQLWLGSLGCIIGGLYMLYRRMTREKLVVH